MSPLIYLYIYIYIYIALCIYSSIEHTYMYIFIYSLIYVLHRYHKQRRINVVDISNVRVELRQS